MPPIISKFSYPTVERITYDDGTRTYLCPVFKKPVPSVTTILSATADKEGLILWEEAVGKRKADRVRMEAANLGTLMHTNLENHLQGEPFLPGSHPLRVLAAKMAETIVVKGFPNIQEVYGMEVVMFLAGLFAGTTDLVGLHEGELAIMDYKTTKKMKTVDMIVDYFDQIAAYRLAHNDVHGTEINKAVVIMVARDLEYKEFVLNKEMLDYHQQHFLDRVGLYYEKMADTTLIGA